MRHIYICLQFYSTKACFPWRPEHFKFPGYGGARHKATIEYVETFILLEVRALGRVLM